jgi:hypothetical protein
LFSIETKYGFENVFRMSATFTRLPLELAELELPLLAPPELLELLEPHAAIVSAAALATATAAKRRRVRELAPKRLRVRALPLLGARE